MKRRITAKFLLGYLLFGLLSFAGIALLGSRLYLKAARESAADELYREARVLASYQTSSYTSPLQYDLTALKALTELTEVRVLILNDSYAVVYDSTEGVGLTGRRLSGFNPADSDDYYRLGDFYGAFREKNLSVFFPIVSELKTRGYVTLHLPYEIIRLRADKMLAWTYIIFGGIFLLSMTILLFLRITVLKPLRAITGGASEFAQGHMDYRIAVKSRDEMGYLANTLNLMAEELKNADNYQKKFIANVSHDFRSPLTSIKGYLQAIIDGVIPPEDQDKYMQIIISETERLSNLTQSMLALNSLDRKRLKLEISDFDLVSLTKSICETFEGTCAKRDISFDLEFSAPVLTVRADMGRIQQVLYNLIDNAVKFSNDGSSIRIRLEELGSKVSVSVKDYGIGISKEELGKIWTRFYKTDASRGKDKKGTGLGLSIVKEALNAHGETIDVASTPGSGTEFRFHLPLSE